MRQYRVATKQGHPVPQSVTRASGPFPPELYAHQPINCDYTPEGEDFPPGATAQNNFRPEKLLRCRICMDEVYESETADHVCPEDSEESHGE